jgi:hypothetical protein
MNEVSLGQGEGERGTDPAEPDDRNFHLQKIIRTRADGKRKNGGAGLAFKRAPGG